jgi:hypothetical protein
MRVEFADETWVYRLYEDGRIKKVISKDRWAFKKGIEQPLAQTESTPDRGRLGPSSA